MKTYLFFDNASTTKCCDAALAQVCRLAQVDYGNPSSAHPMGETGARAINEARSFFADHFQVEPRQIIFTASGTESDNLAITGTFQAALLSRSPDRRSSFRPRIITSSVDHPAVRRTVASLADFGAEPCILAPNKNVGFDLDRLQEIISPSTLLVSIQQVNNLTGMLFPIEKIAELVKQRQPNAVVHTDAVQAFGRIAVPRASSGVDLVSISGHKIEGPKGVGALAVLNPKLLQKGLRPTIFGGGQEGGFRSGTQNAGLIAGFHRAAEQALREQEARCRNVALLAQRLRDRIKSNPRVTWNSPIAPEQAIPDIVSLSVSGCPAGALARLLGERGCIVGTGSACDSHKSDPDPVLESMGYSTELSATAIRISFSRRNTNEEVDQLVVALTDAIQAHDRLFGGKRR